MKTKKRLIVGLIIIVISILLINIFKHILYKKDYEFLSYMNNKYGEEFILNSKLISFPSFMQKYFVLYGHSKKDKTMTFTGQYEFLDNNEFRMYDDYDVTLYAKQKSDELNIELDKLLKNNFAVKCIPRSVFAILGQGELERYKNNINLHFIVFVESSDYNKIKDYYNKQNNEEIETFLNKLNNMYSSFKSEQDGEIQYSRIAFIKTKNIKKIKNNVLTIPNSSFNIDDYSKYVYEDDNKNEESVQFYFKDSGIERITESLF